MKTVCVSIVSAIVGALIVLFVQRGLAPVSSVGSAPAAGDRGARHESGDTPELELSMAQKAKLRDGEEKTRQLQEIGALRRQPLAKFLTLDYRRKITPIALREAGIPEGESEGVQREFDQAWSEVEGLISERAVVTSPENPGDPYVVEVSAEVERGNATLDSLKKRLGEKYGEKASEILLSGYDDSRTLGAYGRQNRRIEIIYNEVEKEWEFKNFQTNPFTGEITRKQECVADRFIEQNGAWVFRKIGVDL